MYVLLTVLTLSLLPIMEKQLSKKDIYLYYTLEKCIQQIIFKQSSSCVIFHLQCDQ